ncbi:hypothetical protein BN12_2200006 [Nostocoides japonicum T1-X7]|uniref:Uncharacterized protein n=1 Tax=Nostocoides japonicum T1-X7 TaxID=1194083 RepID=A0A077M0M9_9MICO|nr:hypothetical protein [Tetrasphaera japonica]CCH77765.1 hypothetical protein BN12_2200006 [Tetrasphaera japonica T1-X7]
MTAAASALAGRARRVDLTGVRMGRLTILQRLPGSRWLARCDCGRRTVVTTGHLTSGDTRSCGDRAHRRSLTIRYRSAHDRIRRIYGPARHRRCIDCGRPASHWSYDHRDPLELHDGPRRYSLDPDHYQARCVPCHRLFDEAYLATATTPAPSVRFVVQLGLLAPDPHLDALGPPTGAPPWPLLATGRPPLAPGLPA